MTTITEKKSETDVIFGFLVIVMGSPPSGARRTRPSSPGWWQSPPWASSSGG
ncbi:MAG TPA: hypothetical protein VEO91_12620 [Candidatus Limnocylindria bacterium]|nr:hypothetical protein [Candidatus Limnocylindria bacterium]